MKITDIINEGLDQPTRRGFLKGLASFAASAAVPTSVVKMLSTPAGVASLPVAAGIALLKGIRDHLAQWDEESGSAGFDAHESMVELLGFEERTATKNDNDNDPRNRVGDDLSAEDQMYDLLYLYRTNPELAAAQLIKHLQSASIDPADVKSSFVSRADDPSDSRYQTTKSEPYDFYTSNTPEENKIVIYTTDFDGNIVDSYVRDNRESDPIELLNQKIAGDENYNRFYKYSKYTATSGGKPVRIDNEKYIDPGKLSTALSPKEASEKMYKMWDAGIDPKDDTSLSTMTRLAGLAKGADTSTNPAPAAKDMGPVQYANNMPALPAPTKPEFDLAPGLKQKEKVPVSRNDDTMSEKLGDNRPTLGSKRDQGKSVRQWRKQRGLDESAN